MGRWKLALAGALASALALLGSAAQAAEPYDINVVLSLTGSGAFLGKTERKSFELLQSDVNQEGGVAGRSLRFLFTDDQSSPQTSLQIVSGLVAQHPAVIIGPNLVATCNAVMPLARNGPVTYCLTPGAYPPAGGFVFTAQPATRSNMEALLTWFATRGWTRLAFLNSTDATGRDAEKDFDAVLKLPGNESIRVVAREHFNPGDLAVGAQLQIIKDVNPQVLLAWTTGAAVATVFKGLSNAGMNVPVVTTNGNQTYEQMRQYADFLPHELYLPSTEWPAGAQKMTLSPGVTAALARYEQALSAADVLPDSPLAVAWDPASIIVDLLRRLGAQATADQLRGALATLQIDGIAGHFDFRKIPQRGLDATSVLITRWDPRAQLWRIVSEPGGGRLAEAAAN